MVIMCPIMGGVQIIARMTLSKKTVAGYVNVVEVLVTDIKNLVIAISGQHIDVFPRFSGRICRIIRTSLSLGSPGQARR